MFGVIQWVYHFGHELVLLSNLQHRTSVFMSAAIIGGRENCEQLATGESFETVHHTFVCSKNEFASVSIEEVLHSVGAELYDVPCAIRVSDEIWLDA